MDGSTSSWRDINVVAFGVSLMRVVREGDFFFRLVCRVQ